MTLALQHLQPCGMWACILAHPRLTLLQLQSACTIRCAPSLRIAFRGSYLAQLGRLLHAGECKLRE